MSRIKVSTTESRIRDLDRRLRNHVYTGGILMREYNDLKRRLDYVLYWFKMYTNRGDKK